MRRVAIIGSGFSGLSAAAYLAKNGCEVDLYEKNSTIGGRARQFSENGFKFDMGPSWYWMPEVFESFFNDFGYHVSDFYKLQLLSPSFDLVFTQQEKWSIPSEFSELLAFFDSVETGSSDKLKLFLKDAKTKYNIGFSSLIEQPGLSILEYLSFEIIKQSLKLDIFSSYQKLVHKHFKSPKLRSLMEFPVLFLGAKPKDTPALYSLMNYAGLQLGTWYPIGGFYEVIKAMKKVAEELGVNIITDSNVSKIKAVNNRATGLMVGGKEYAYDGIISSADYQHTESQLLEKQYRNYSENYWETKTFAPSSLIFYLGLNKKIDQIAHHTLFFDEDFEQHANQIYTNKAWPDKPLFYVCAPSKTDKSVAPDKGENLFLLMPLATGLKDTTELREKYFKILIERLEKQIKTNITDHIIVKKSYCSNDFKADYNAYAGNAYGLANTLSQTAIFKPKAINKKLSNLVYAGQLTVPGPGVPPSIISGKIASKLMLETLNKT